MNLNDIRTKIKKEICLKEVNSGVFAEEWLEKLNGKKQDYNISEDFHYA
ncbi:MAG: hypothetical protein ACP5L4_05680 [Thermoplasmata archaeon]